MTARRRFPLISTTVVGLAVALMIGLGVWQLQRKAWKEGLLAQYAANLHLPRVTFPRDAVGHDELLFRKSTVLCRDPGNWVRQVGRNQRGQTGWLLIGACRGEAGGSFKLGLGVTTDPMLQTNWRGGMVSGVITHAPDHGSLIGSMFAAPKPKELMLVADTAPPPLAASAAPDPAGVPNNHLAYAGQWFLFAGIALVIYALALRHRAR